MPGLARSWWAAAIRGLIAVVFGLIALFWPGLALGALIIVFGAYAFVDGVFALVAAVRSAEHHTSWWVQALEGILGIIAGIVAFVWPGLTALALLYVIAAWALVTGLLEVAAAYRLRHEGEGTEPWLLGLAGLASIIFGLLLVAFPGAGALAVLWLIGVFALIFGVLLLVMAWRLYQHQPAV
jgi:uncharacterized membrane protein HdeD (DUF308 family)